MEYIKSVPRQFSFRIHICLMLSIICLVFCDPNFVSSAETYYYYLHVSSHRLKMRADMNVALLQNKGYDTIIRREQVADRGYWYRVYIGPFSSLREAKLKRHELRTGNGCLDRIAPRAFYVPHAGQRATRRMGQQGFG